MVRLRRSQRCHAANYDSNGRDYLASELGYTRSGLEKWLAAPEVHQHLALWYNLCVLGRRRYNDAIDWIIEGEEGYFYDKQGLEEDVLLTCLGEGNAKILEGQELSDFIEDGVNTSNWSTAKLWARTAWRIVQSNCSEGQCFRTTIVRHPAAAYGLTIDVLCLAFHSIAYRKAESIWHGLVTQESSQSLNLYSKPGFASIVGAAELDESDHGSVIGESTTEHVDVASYAVSVLYPEESVSEVEYSKTPVKARRRRDLSPPPAPKKKATRAFQSQKSSEWVDSLPFGSPRAHRYRKCEAEEEVLLVDASWAGK
ncbi:hypothetical protein CERZMDRAFT_93478 [Cercospora zeae-maydis SCOH1-5]|uniref:Uncharacterized protein n=1 Tax=Cercospora zeae-maydis SCOH1-5 TaxID=717836 RepID=A0A6A6FSA1_9PEZI|nr:hypothetical protein CERZMDRAFT_93478 [Cercospora zeae-maydis SCOH1-5]